MRPFVPCIAAELQSEDTCDRLAAIRLLGEIGDPAAIDPLLALLGDHDGIEPLTSLLPSPITADRVEVTAISVLSHQLRAPQVVPHIVRRIPVSDEVVGVAGSGVVSIRILDALLWLYGSDRPNATRHSMLRALVHQSRANPGDPRLLEILWQIIGEDLYAGSATHLAKVICTREHFPALVEVYLTRYADQCSLHGQLYELLETLAGDQWQGYLEQLVIHTVNKRCCTQYADDLLAYVCSTREDAPRDLQQVVECFRGLGHSLASASEKGMRPLVLGAMSGAQPQERADAWTEISGMAPGNLELQLLATRSLYLAHQVDGTGRLEQAVAAATRYQELGGSALASREGQGVTRLQWLLANREILARSALELVAVEGEPGGTWTAVVKIITEPSSAATLRSSRPLYGFVDQYRDQEHLATIATRVRISGNDPSDGIELVLEWRDSQLPEPPPTDLRIRLLFMAGEGQGFRGVLESGAIFR